MEVDTLKATEKEARKEKHPPLKFLCSILGVGVEGSCLALGSHCN